MAAPKPESIAKKKKLEKVSWTTKPCAICAKPVQVHDTHGPES